MNNPSLALQASKLGAAVGRNQIRISKIEIRDKSEIQMFQTQVRVAESLDGTVSDFGHSHFEFVSSFVLLYFGF